jgi:hypothetical protein
MYVTARNSDLNYGRSCPPKVRLFDLYALLLASTRTKKICVRLCLGMFGELLRLF